MVEPTLIEYGLCSLCVSNAERIREHLINKEYEDALIKVEKYLDTIRPEIKKWEDLHLKDNQSQLIPPD